MKRGTTTNPYGLNALTHLECGWDHFFLAEAFFLSGKSKDPSTQCGCVVVSRDNDELTRGWNDLPRGIAHRPERHQRPDKYIWTEHAERNAIYNAGRMGVSLQGATLYVTRMPCPECARAIIQSGIKYVCSIIYEDEFEWAERTKTVEAHDMLKEAGVFVSVFAPDTGERLKRFRYGAG